ncbi:unnamed protein product [Timema podura]|uniref:SRA1/Sec31 domain-containing protein n=1 Tax=Timema podura TaxID=61482 RepID=A0ABN7P9N2_TIMPD|nr:unnamed protein product [Timema podura]
MPPLPPVSALPPSSSLPSYKPEEAASNYGLELTLPPVLSKQEGIERVMANLTSVLESASEDIKKNKEEICRRLDAMKKMWDEDILKPEIHQRLLTLSDALKGGDGVLADQIHIGLMVDHVSLCSPWMAGVRYLIHHVKNQTQACETGEEES